MITALFFGSFNPIHQGHLAIARYVLEQQLSDDLWFVVSPQNPLKDSNILIDDKHRVEMVRLAATILSGAEMCDVECHMSRPSYTFDTMCALEKQFPGHEWRILQGTDNLHNFDKWKNYNYLEQHYQRLVYPRPGNDLSNLPNMVNARLVNAPLLDISSTAIRSMLKDGGGAEGLVPDTVLEYIRKYGLYR
jgi:nicotinate-nucleotide adenylyltransferase